MRTRDVAMRWDKDAFVSLFMSFVRMATEDLDRAPANSAIRRSAERSHFRQGCIAEMNRVCEQVVEYRHGLVEDDSGILKSMLDVELLSIYKRGRVRMHNESEPPRSLRDHEEEEGEEEEGERRVAGDYDDGEGGDAR
jgi:hypothetical protein